MFGKLKEKLKSWVGKISEIKDEKGIKDELKKSPKKIKEKQETKIQKEKIISKIEEHIYIQPEEKAFDETERKVTQKIHEDIEKEKKSSLLKQFLTGKKTITKKEFDEYAKELEMILLENNVALPVSDKIIKELEEKIVGCEFSKKEIKEKIIEDLKKIILDVLIDREDLIKEIKEKKEKPYVMLFCGINGTGKTTTIAKLGKSLNKNQISCVFGAADTFRAAAVEQLKKHGENLRINVISNKYGSDPASVGFDTIKYAQKNKINAVLIDTAGRIHTAQNLIREMEKIKRVTKPDKTIFVGEAITGNDSIEQIKAFNENIGIDAIILSKADIDEKGGTILSLGYITKKPILFLGTGQNYDDLEPFDKNKFIEKLGI